MAGTAGTETTSSFEIDIEFARLVDQLVPPEPTPRRRLLAGFAVAAVAIVTAVAWVVGLIAPNPSHGTSSSSSTALVAIDEPETVAVTGLWFRNTSLVTLELSDVRIDAPGLTIERLEWYRDDPVDSDDAGDRAGGAAEDAVAGGVSEASSPRSGNLRDMLLRPDETMPLPATLDPGQSAWVVAVMTVESCIDPTSTWGTVQGRWEYPDRPSWWRRWERLDEPLWTPEEFFLHNYVTLDGEPINADGPLSGACRLLETAS